MLYFVQTGCLVVVVGGGELQADVAHTIVALKLEIAAECAELESAKP